MLGYFDPGGLFAAARFDERMADACFLRSD
jgi:hypothetical protein